MWDQLEPTGPHLTYLTFTVFLITYALFSQFIRNNLHLSEPPVAVLFGIILGPYVLNWITPKLWGLDDGIMQEVTRVIVGIQCFAVGIELPKYYFNRHWKSVLYFLGPIMTFSWAISALFAYSIFKTSIPTAILIGACLSPTDPVLSASVLSNSRFSERVPARLKNLLSAESACNDGVSFPFLYIGIVAFKYSSSTGEAVKEWFLITILWQCAVGIIVGLILGTVANRILRFCDSREYISESSFVVFYLLLAILSIGIGSTLGSDDFLVAFGAGVGFAHDGWFSKKTRATPFPFIIDMILNSGMFIFFGSIIPFDKFVPHYTTPDCGLWQLFLFLALVILFRRIPVVLAMKRVIPELHTYREALFCGHFGPPGVGALFLAIEARAQLETGTSIPEGEPDYSKPLTDKQRAIFLIWPVICFIVLGSTMVYGLSTLVISIVGHFARPEGERAPLLGQETEGLDAMVHDTASEEEASENE
jgi:NhaP-type Na+/H+ or K+/H+ antiporter